eukprot:3187077-Amphidinium_carterae.2
MTHEFSTARCMQTDIVHKLNAQQLRVTILQNLQHRPEQNEYKTCGQSTTWDNGAWNLAPIPLHAFNDQCTR